MSENDDNGRLTELVMAYLQDQTMRQLESYLKRGRALENRDAEELKERWLVVFREMTDLDNTHERERNDIEAELSLRDDEPPYEDVKAELDAFGKKVNALVDESTRETDIDEDENNALLVDFRAFLDSIDEPSN